MRLEIPVLETARLRLRAPRLEDQPAFDAFLGSPRGRFVGGPVADRGTLVRSWGHVAGLWLLRGFGLFVLEEKATGAPLGIAGPWFPATLPETETSWSLWSGAAEGRGLVAEACAAILPWVWDRTGLTSAISVVDEANRRSRRVAERLGALPDPEATAMANRPGSSFHDPDHGPDVVYRHRARP